ncbi:hypothetical protein TUBRATIS_30390 [Tubulinosema ratisbonensis]|uniref:Uncharacterized protein n=1 Tax=Tubulinosema ratisbonensis TaxID=291195 RepID=A0A437AH96_9MICR|nr:hypothetical protein TUBRATIS_30390 [Tubulinosema ratisbonensis]
MIYSDDYYKIFAFLHALRFITFIIYLRVVIDILADAGVKLESTSLFLSVMFFVITFISFVAFSTVFVSKKLKLFMPYVVIEGHTVLFSIVVMPYITKPYLFLSFIIPVVLGYLLVLYNYEGILKLEMAIETQKYNLNKHKQRAIKVRAILTSVRFITYFFFFAEIIIKLSHERCFLIKKTDYKSWIYYVSIIDLIASFYEREEYYLLKVCSIASISTILICIIVHWIIYFDSIKSLTRIVVIFDIIRFLIYLIYTIVDFQFYSSGIKEYFEAKLN